MAKYESILETIGHTPAVRIQTLAPHHVELWVKIEAFNPMGSVKDRLALGVIEDAERKGLLKPGQTVVEATSGNTGIGLAMVCAKKGYPLVVTMAENFSVERRKLMRFLGAKVVLTPAAQKGTGMLAKAVELAEAHGWFLARQFENEANADIHSETTAKEILSDFEGERLDWWITGTGTGGTLKGVARILKQERPTTGIAVCEPDNAQILGSGVAQSRGPDGQPADSHPAFRPHLMQGWTPDFIPRLAEDALQAALVDRFVPVNGADAIRLSRELARKEGIFVGTSAGATFAGALKIAEDAPDGSVILCMLPDTGERYLSTPLFDGISEEMTEEEIDISRSTPSFRFDVATPSPAPQATAEALTAPDSEAVAFVERTVTAPERPVVMFALEWCEFCWSVRKLFQHLGIDYESIDLDSVAYQEADMGGRIRQALRARTSFTTIPQIFIGGEFMGGCTDLFDAWKNGVAQEKMKSAGVRFNEAANVDPYSFLPGWLHPR
jgi:cysteine synthase